MKIASVELGSTIRELEEAVDRLTIPRESPAFKVGALLLAALLVGTDPGVLAAFTGYSPEFIDEVSERLKAAEIWDEGKPSYDWWFEVDDDLFTTIAFCSDALVGEGVFFRCWSVEAGEYHYGLLDDPNDRS